MITKIKNQLVPNLMNPSAHMYESLIEHINMQGDKINELIDEFNQLKGRSIKPSESGDYRWVCDGRDSSYTTFYRCPCCNYVVASYIEFEFEFDYKFCPCCGVKLRK